MSAATSSLTTRIDATDESYSVIASDVTDLKVGLALIDSDFISGIAGATANTTLLARLDANSDSISTLSGQYTNLGTTLDILDSGAVTTIAAAADTILEASIIATTDGKISVVSKSVTDLTTSLKDSENGTVLTGSAVNALSTRLDADSNKMSSVSESLTNLTATLKDSENGTVLTGSALSSLSAAVYDSENGIGSLSSDIVSLNNSLYGDSTDSAGAGLIAQSAALSELTSSLKKDPTTGNIIVDARDATNLSGAIGNTIKAEADDALSILLYNNSDGIAAISGNLTTLTNTLKDSPNGTVLSGSAVSSLTSAVFHDSTGLSSLNSDFTELKGTLGDSTGGIIASVAAFDKLSADLNYDPATGKTSIDASKLTNLSAAIGDTVNASGSDELSILLYNNSDGVGAISGKLTSLTNTLKDSPNGTVLTGSAVSGLTSRMDADSASLSILNSDYTRLKGTLEDSATGLFADVEALELLTSKIVLDSDGNLVVEASSITELSSTINNATASATSGLITTAMLDSAVDGISVPDLTSKYFVNLNAGVFAGFELLSGASVSSLVMSVNDFKVQTPSGDNTPFSVNTVDGIVEMENVRLKGELDIEQTVAGEGTLKIDNQTIVIKDALGNDRVRFGKLTPT